jgi:lysozyme
MTMMNPTTRQLARKLIMKHEEFRRNVYTDTTGNLTIGYGHALKLSSITQHAGEVILDDDLFWHAVHVPEAISFFNTLSPARQAVLLDMSYNLGLQGLLEFHDMLEALKNGDYEKAADEMLNSKWAEQVKTRAKENAYIMRSDSL